VKKGKRNLRNYNPESLEKALIEVKSGTMNQHQAARVYGVPRSTITTRISMWKRLSFCITPKDK
jgi:transposase